MNQTIQGQFAGRIRNAVVEATIGVLLRDFHLPALPTLRMTCVDWVKSHEGLVEAVYEGTASLDSAVLGQVVASGYGDHYEQLVQVGLDALRAPTDQEVPPEFFNSYDRSGTALLRQHATMVALSIQYRHCKRLSRLTGRSNLAISHPGASIIRYGGSNYFFSYSFLSKPSGSLSDPLVGVGNMVYHSPYLVVGRNTTARVSIKVFFILK